MRRTDQGETQPAFKAWLTAAEIHEEQLPSVGTSLTHVQSLVAEIKASNPRFLWRQRPIEKHPDHARGRSPGSGVEIHFTCLPLEAIVAYEARHRPSVEAAQPGDRRLARLGTGTLSTAHGGQLRAFIVKTLTAEPCLPIVGLRDRCIEHFGLDVVIIAQGRPALVPMPPLRTFQEFVRGQRARGFAHVGS